MNENYKYSNKGFITNWNYVLDNGQKAGDELRHGNAKLIKGNGNRVYLKVENDKEYRVQAALSKGIKDNFWYKPND